MRPAGCRTRLHCSTVFPANSSGVASISPPRLIGGAVSVAAQDAVVDTKGKTDGHDQTEIETRKSHSQNLDSRKTSSEGARNSPLEARALC